MAESYEQKSQLLTTVVERDAGQSLRPTKLKGSVNTPARPHVSVVNPELHYKGSLLRAKGKDATDFPQKTINQLLHARSDWLIDELSESIGVNTLHRNITRPELSFRMLTVKFRIKFF